MTPLSRLIQVYANTSPLLNFLNMLNLKIYIYHWYFLQELLVNMSSNGLTFDFICITEVVKIQVSYITKITVITIYYSVRDYIQMMVTGE